MNLQRKTLVGANEGPLEGLQWRELALGTILTSSGYGEIWVSPYNKTRLPTAHDTHNRVPCEDLPAPFTPTQYPFSGIPLTQFQFNMCL